MLCLPEAPAKSKRQKPNVQSLQCARELAPSSSWELVRRRRRRRRAGTTRRINRPRRNIELCKLGQDLPAIRGPVGLDGVEDGNPFHRQRARVRHPAERHRITRHGIDAQDFVGDGRLAALAGGELREGGEGGDAGGLAREEVDAV